jgi:hypothetical protein
LFWLAARTACKSSVGGGRCKIDFNVTRAGVTGRSNGDFNYDGKLNVDDYGMIDFNVGNQHGFGFESASGVGGEGSVVAGLALGANKGWDPGRGQTD